MTTAAGSGRAAELAARLRRAGAHPRAPLGIALLALVAHGPIWLEFVAENPFSEVLRSDAALYWRMAGALAAGQGFGDEPLRIAPLYPLALGLARRLGAEPPLVGALQLLLHAATVVLVGAAAGRLWGRPVGTTAAALFALLTEPALFAPRLQSVTLQLFAVAGLWWASVRARSAEPTAAPWHGAHVGAWTGLAVLAYPAALLLAPALAIVPLLRRRAAGLPAAAATGAAALLVVAPATWHNWRASGEWTPVTAHAGITLAHGNGPRSVGIYTPVDGVSTAIERQHADAAAVFERAHGRPGSWGEVDAHFRERVVSWWLEEPLAATALMGRKLLWLAASRDYDNVVAVGLEREAGLQDASLAAPLAIPWLLGFGALGAAAWVGRARREGRVADVLPEAALLGLPVLVCVAFYFSARYRVVIAPVLCGVAALGLARAARARGAALAVGAGVPLGLALVAGWSGATDTGFARQGFGRALEHARLERAVRAERAGRPDEADRWLAAAAEDAPESALVPLQRAIVALGRGRPGDALAPARTALERASDPDLALRVLYNALGAARRDREALPLLRRLRAARPDERPLRLALAWLRATSADPDVRDGEAALALLAPELARPPVEAEVALVAALARAEAGDRAAAVETARAGARRARAVGRERLARDLEGLAAHLEAGAAIRLPARGLALPGAAPEGRRAPVS